LWCEGHRHPHLGGSALNCANRQNAAGIFHAMIRKLKSGEYRLYSRKKNAKTGKRRNLGTFSSLAAAKKHEPAVQYFKRA
jgi:23S rRNA maturation mini-RNase III